ncbi:hypothetical protein [Sedimentibacter sp. MB31-C6]|uniref:hypothetical protein n=1 Tax=Sedimentibacter sp. MB31-C6 TaxID=3109366 RepID=UPI002DDCC85F|nr:hypothetical protein [Sedimentibacter sp. MB36-C1]WSI02861.1 hypothetical protein U8307_07340 [Sedimentibacter sp. MB36-C1]
MKFKYLILVGVIIIVVFIIYIYSNKEESQLTRSREYTDTIQLGLQGEGLTEDQILFIEPLKDNEELIFFSNYNALAFACLSKIKDEWLWKRTDPMYDFQSTDSSSYMTSMVEITTIKNHNYYLYLGEIFNPKINKITLHNDTINARIVKIDNNTFWFTVIDIELIGGDYLNIDTKAYDDLDSIIE